MGLFFCFILFKINDGNYIKNFGSDLSPCCRYWYCRGRGGVLQTVLQGEGSASDLPTSFSSNTVVIIQVDIVKKFRFSRAWFTKN